MDLLPLAEFDLREWFNLAVIVLIFGGSAVGGFLKWLVTKFRDNATEQVKPPAPKATVSRGGESRHEAVTHPPPVARPMPPHGTGRPRAKRLLPARPPESVRSRSRTAPPAKLPRATGRPGPTTGSGPMPKSRLQPDQPLSAELVGPATERTLIPHRSVALSHIEDRADLMGHLDPEEHLQFSPQEEPLGRLAQAADAPRKRGTSGGPDSPDALDPIRHPTRRGLRHAMIMKELLGPPLGLQPPGQFGPG